MPILATLRCAVLVLASLATNNSIERIPNIAYEKDATYAHSLDLFLPADRTNAPLVVFVHGGAFLEGDRRYAGAVGAAFARQGLATAVVSYRLFPNADAHGATEDVAMATAWMIQHASEYGISAHVAFVVGHSAGAQIAALIATDPRYMGKAGLTLRSLGGAFAVSGAYDVRDLSDEPDSWQKVDGHIYGEQAARAEVSPAQHIDAATPAIEVACGTEEDNPGSCDRAFYFERALRKAGVTTKLIRENGPSHIGMLRALMNPKDPLNQELLAFIERQSHWEHPK